MNLKDIITDKELLKKSSDLPPEEAKILDEIAQEVFQREGEKQRIRLENEAEQEKLLSKKLTNQNRTNH